MFGGLFQICCLLLGFLSSTSDAQVSQEEQALVTPKGISVLFWEMPEASTVSLAIGFKHAGLHDYPSGALLAQTMRKSVEQLINTDSSIPFKKLEFGDPFFDFKCFNLHLEGDAAQLEEALQWVMRQLQSMDSTQFIAARQDWVQALDTSVSEAEKEKNTTVTKIQSPEWRLKTNATLSFAEDQVNQQLGLPNIVSKVGRLARVKRLRWQDMTNYAARYLTREHLIITAAGPIQPEVLLHAIDNTLGQLPASSNKTLKKTTRPLRPPKLPKKQFFQQKDINIPNIICFGHPLPTSAHIDRYARGPLIDLIFDMMNFYVGKETASKERKEGDRPIINNLSIDIREGSRRLTGYFSASNKTAASHVEKIEQFFKEVKEKGTDIAWLPHYLEQLKQKNTMEKIRKALIEEVESPLVEEMRNQSNGLTYYLLNKHIEVLARIPAGLSDYIAYLKKFQIEDLIPLIQTVLNPDQLVFTEVGHENHLLRPYAKKAT